MKENIKNVLIGIGFGIAGISTVGLCYSVVQTANMKRMIAGSTERISQLSHVDIDQRLIDRMVQKSVKEQAGYATRMAAENIQRETLADIRNRVKQAVSNQTDTISKKVAANIVDQISESDKDEIIEQVIGATTDRLVEKLGDDLDSEVGKIGKIYQGIAAALS